jgi:hypothetical protein
LTAGTTATRLVNVTLSKRQGKAVSALASAFAVLLLMPALALAKVPVAESQSEPESGITATGTGLATVEPPRRLSEESIRAAVEAKRAVAVSRALNEARRHAKAIAGVAGLTLGPAVAIYEPQTFFFGPSADIDQFCRTSPRRPGRPRCRVPKFVAATVEVRFASPETETPAASEGEIVVAGAARSPVEPAHRDSNSSIRQAVARAEAAAMPAALAAARRQGERFARAAGLSLGPIRAVSEEGADPYAAGIIGPFGPGRFCGVIRRPVFERTPGSHRRRIVRFERRRHCYVPPFATSRLRVTFARG